MLVNPGVAVPTKDVFAALAAPALASPARADDFFEINTDAAALVSLLAARRNDLEIPAVRLQAVIADVLERAAGVSRLPAGAHVGLGRDLFRRCLDPAAAAQDVAQRMQADHPGWWVRATRFS